MEVLPHRQKRVMLDGSRKLTLRNRKYFASVQAVKFCRTRELKSVKPKSGTKQQCVFKDCMSYPRGWPGLRVDDTVSWGTENAQRHKHQLSRV